MSIDDLVRKANLESTDMAPVQGTVELDVPIEMFTHANLWPKWKLIIDSVPLIAPFRLASRP